jgi:hypothetical protein
LRSDLVQRIVAPVEVDVGPTQPAQLTAAGAGERTQAEEQRQGLRRLADDPNPVRGRRWADVGLRSPGPIDLGGRVAHDEVEPLGQVEGGSEDVVHAADRLLAEATCPEERVQLLDVHWAEALDGDRTDVRGDVPGDALMRLVVGPGSPAGRPVEDVAFDELPDREARRRHRPPGLDFDDQPRQLTVGPHLAPPVVGRVDRPLVVLALARHGVFGVDRDAPGAGPKPLVPLHEQRV